MFISTGPKQDTLALLINSINTAMEGYTRDKHRNKKKRKTKTNYDTSVANMAAKYPKKFL